MVARTRYARPRYFPIVFALAGDSTITRDVAPGSDGVSSSMILEELFLARVGLTAALAAPVFVARFRTVVFLAVLAFAISSAPSCYRRFRTNLPGQFPRAAPANHRARCDPRTA